MANAKSAKDEGVLSELYEEFEPGVLSMVEEREVTNYYGIFSKKNYGQKAMLEKS